MDTGNSEFHQGFTLEVQVVESFGFRKCPQNFLRSLLMLQEVGKLPTRVYFPYRSRIGLGSALGSVWMAFKNQKNTFFWVHVSHCSYKASNFGRP